MEIFVSTLNQTAFLFGFIIIGFVLLKFGFLPSNSTAVLSKLENMIFLPALVLGTFIDNFTIARIQSAWKTFAISFAIAFIAIPAAISISKLFSKDRYTQKIYTYGLSFSNFGFMGNAVVKGLFPEIFFDYLLFTLPLYILIYAWGVPALLVAGSGKQQGIKERVKAFLNPMFIAMLIGMGIGLLNWNLPTFVSSLISVSGDCMSPVAMLLTGMAVSRISLWKTFINLKLYGISLIRLFVFPLVFMLVARFLPLSETIYLCALCSLAMPLGLNTIVVPSAYGKDTTVASGMAILSHLLSCISIPVLFSLVGKF